MEPCSERRATPFTPLVRVALKVAVIGAGWAGCAAAVEATRLGHSVTLYEATRSAGGRARRVESTLRGQSLMLDNGQHILIGAYTETLDLMALVGVNPAAVLLRIPLTLRFPDGTGLQFRALVSPLDALHAMATARGWSWRERLALLRRAWRWQVNKFECTATLSVADLCAGLPDAVMHGLIEPLCVSALNTPASRASGQVFLRVLKDALFQANGGSNLLLPRVDLSALLPDAALAWLAAHGAQVLRGQRVQALRQQGSGWGVTAGDTTDFECVVLACPVSESLRLVRSSGLPSEDWQARAQALAHEALTTVYALAPDRPGAMLSHPMLTLRSDARYPAQFVFDRGQLGGPAGLLAFVISASSGDSAALTEQVLAQAKAQLGLHLQPLQTIVEKRATFACTPGLQRPQAELAPTLLACGDYIAGPYPATLEGAVRSGLAAARNLTPVGTRA